MSETLSDLALGALRELSLVFTRMSDDCADELIDAIITARKIVLFGCGREGLQMRGLAMRLFHLGRDATVWGDMSMPAVGRNDPLVVSAGPGDLATARVLVCRARKAGARTALITAQPEAPLAAHVDVVMVIPAQTMADDRVANSSILPMGSLFEIAQMVNGATRLTKPSSGASCSPTRDQVGPFAARAEAKVEMNEAAN